MQNLFVRNLESEDLVELFLVSAVSSILAIRFYLHLTNYPQIGGGGLHIAHMLWGGLFMAIAIILLLNFINKFVFNLAAILGGIGFGTFIDELGKFITKDNNYFFEPTIALIYVVFVILYFGSRFIQKYHPTKTEYMGNAILMAREAILEGWNKNQFEEAQKYLDKLPQNSTAVKLLNQLFVKLKIIPDNKYNLYKKFNNFLKQVYLGFVNRRIFRIFIISLFFLQILYALSQSDLVIAYATQNNPQNLHLTVAGESKSVGETGYILSEALATVFVILGVIFLFKSRLRAYNFFKIAILISLFLTQFFDFYASQFMALPGFIGNLILLEILNTMSAREKELEMAKA